MLIKAHTHGTTANNGNLSLLRGSRHRVKYSEMTGEVLGTRRDMWEVKEEVQNDLAIDESSRLEWQIHRLKQSGSSIGCKRCKQAIRYPIWDRT